MNILLILSVACLAVGIISIFISASIRNELYDHIEKIENNRSLTDKAFLDAINSVDYRVFETFQDFMNAQLKSHAEIIEDVTKKVNEYIATRQIDTGEELRLMYTEKGNWRIANKEHGHEL